MAEISVGINPKSKRVKYGMMKGIIMMIMTLMMKNVITKTKDIIIMIEDMKEKSHQ